MKIAVKDYGLEALKIGLGIGSGFGLFWLTSHPTSPINKKIPVVKLRNVSFAPHIKVVHKERHFHLHHWANIASLYIVLLSVKGKSMHKSLHGFFIGSILQGLFYSDRFTFVYKPKAAI